MDWYICRRRAIAALLLSVGGTTPHSAWSATGSGPDSARLPATGLPSAQDKLDAVANSVVKVPSTVRLPDPYKPMAKHAPVDVTDSGIVIATNRILSNAHVVLYAGQVQTQANRAGHRISSTVEGVAPEMELAVPELEDESFFDTHSCSKR